MQQQSKPKILNPYTSKVTPSNVQSQSSTSSFQYADPTTSQTSIFPKASFSYSKQKPPEYVPSDTYQSPALQFQHLSNTSVKLPQIYSSQQMSTPFNLYPPAGKVPPKESMDTSYMTRPSPKFPAKIAKPYPGPQSVTSPSVGSSFAKSAISDQPKTFMPPSSFDTAPHGFGHPHSRISSDSSTHQMPAPPTKATAEFQQKPPMYMAGRPLSTPMVTQQITPNYPYESEVPDVSSNFVTYNKVKESMQNFHIPSKQSAEISLADMSAPAEFMTPTTTILPFTDSARKALNLNYGVVLQPLAPYGKNIPEVNYGKVIRCTQCRTYVNVFVHWDSSGRRWTCNLCHFVNDCPQAYQGPMDETGKRADRFERSELSSGIYEIIAPSDYMIRPPQPPIHLFLIDVTAMSIGSGLLPVVCQAIKNALNSGNIRGPERAQFAIITFDSFIHFYRVINNQIQMLVVTSINDIFVPLPDGVILNYAEHKEALLRLLDELPQMWMRQRITESCMGSAIKAAYAAIKQWGGKLIVFASTIPIIGDLALNSSRGENTATKDVNSLLKPLNDSYSDFSKDVVQAQISVDIFVCALPFQQSPLPMDLPTLLPLIKLTGGQIYYFPCFNAVSSGDKLREEIIHNITRDSAWEAVMRVRISRGWKLKNWYGHFSLRNNDLMVLPTCHSDQSYTLEFDMDTEGCSDPVIYLQFALLYTTSSGERRIRVATLGLSTSSNSSDTLSALDESVYMALVTQQAIQKAQETNLADARKFIQKTFENTYKQLASIHGFQGILPYCTLGLLKSMAFRDYRKLTVDMRIASWARIARLPLKDLKAMLLPRLFSLHDMPDDSGLPGPMGAINLPHTLALSGSNLSQAGVYLAENGEFMVIWVGGATNPSWIKEVFGTEAIDNLVTMNNDSILVATGSRLGLRIAAIVNAIRLQRTPYMQLYIIRQGSSNESLFFNLLIEDRSQASNISFNDLIQSVGIKINTSGKTAAVKASDYISKKSPGFIVPSTVKQHQSESQGSTGRYGVPPPLNKEINTGQDVYLQRTMNRNLLTPSDNTGINAPPPPHSRFNPPPTSNPELNVPPPSVLRFNAPKVLNPGINAPPPSNPGFNEPPPSNPGFNAPPPSNPGFNAPPPSNPRFNAPPPSNPGFNAPPPSNPGFNAPPPSNPGFNAPPPSNPGFNAPPPSNPGFNAPPPSNPGFNAPPPSNPGFNAPPPSNPGFNAPPPSNPGFNAPPPSNPGFNAPPPFNVMFNNPPLPNSQLDASIPTGFSSMTQKSENKFNQQNPIGVSSLNNSQNPAYPSNNHPPKPNVEMKPPSLSQLIGKDPNLDYGRQGTNFQQPMPHNMAPVKQNEAPVYMANKQFLYQ